MKGRLKFGDHWVISDLSGFKSPASEMMKLSGTQKGLVCHKSEWDPPQPQLKIRAREDIQSVKLVRLRGENRFETPPTPDEL